MESKIVPTIELIEQKLLIWEKWLFACYSAAFIMLAHAFIKAYENQMLVNVFFSLDRESGNPNLSIFQRYSAEIFPGLISPWRILFVFLLEIVFLVSFAVLAFHPTWKKIALFRRIDLIFGYLLAGWVTLLSLGAQDPVNASNGYNVLVVIFLLAIGLGYWRLRRKKDKAEEVFP
ncbi:MAG: hypothetical protein C4583_07240 [Anaerolineaceae bacterium]|nr:MAG: hypothetical protein C4583_07240 [Anaerolineaceae bacterium]